LRSVLRQDPDVILVGEIRDLETASIAAQAALTGHLVVSTLHTNNAVQAVIRLVDMGVDPYMVAPALNGVLGQRLARRICARCKQQVEPSVEELAMFEPYGVVPDALYRGEGCVDCAQSGYRGRIGVHEIVVVDDTIRQLIIDRAPLHQVEMAACREGYRSLRYDALKKALAGLTTTSEVRRVTVAREDFVVAG
jgi:type IV pilus assembly protein PilB